MAKRNRTAAGGGDLRAGTVESKKSFAAAEHSGITTADHPHWQWKPGQSGNPSGRPRGVTEVRELAQKFTRPAFAKIIRLMRSAKSEGVQFAAAQELLNRAWGKPDQFVELTVEHKSEMLEKLYATLSGQGATQPKVIENASAAPPDAGPSLPASTAAKP